MTESTEPADGPPAEGTSTPDAAGRPATGAAEAAAAPPAPQPAVPAVEEAERLLDGVAGLPVAERVAVLDAVHRQLQDALATVDEA